MLLTSLLPLGRPLLRNQIDDKWTGKCTSYNEKFLSWSKNNDKKPYLSRVWSNVWRNWGSSWINMVRWWSCLWRHWSSCINSCRLWWWLRNCSWRLLNIHKLKKRSQVSTLTPSPSAIFVLCSSWENLKTYQYNSSLLITNSQPAFLNNITLRALRVNSQWGQTARL